MSSNSLRTWIKKWKDEDCGVKKICHQRKIKNFYIMPLHFIAKNEGFICQNCQKKVEPVKYGGSYRNHCPICLYSKHVDSKIPGDRKSTCLGLMEPIGVFTRRTGEYVLVHKCQTCGFERYNRIAGDDDFEKILKLSTYPILHPTKSI